MISAGSSTDPRATAANAPMPAASIAARSITSTVTPGSSTARAARAVGVRTFAGRFCRSRARLTAAATSAAAEAAPPTSWCADSTSASRPDSSAALNSVYVYDDSSVPSTSPPTTASETWCGTSHASVRAPSSRARPTTEAAAIRARSASNSPRAPSPATM